ncbi:MAG: dCTP deaminase [Actinobacteria bacterium]|nr:dCTP deaminase [Actinomycetota bacterium]
MLLSDRDIKAEVAADRVQIDPYDEGMIQPSSIDVRLDRWFRVFENHKYPHIDPSVEQPDLTRLIEPEGDEPFILHPGEFVLGSTFEVVTLPDDVAGRLEGELSNVATLPITLYPGMKIGQLCLFRLSSPAEHPYGSEKYGSRYQGQRGPTPSRSFANFHRTQV